MIFGAEFLLVIGIFLVIFSLLMLGVAQRVRGWFFLPDLRAEVVKEVHHNSTTVRPLR